MVFRKKPQKSINQLQREVAKEQSKIDNMRKRQSLNLKLKQLKSESDTRVATRIGRGFLILSKKAGKATLKQAKLLRERQIAEEKRSSKRKSRTPSPSAFGPPGF